MVAILDTRGTTIDITDDRCFLYITFAVLSTDLWPPELFHSNTFAFAPTFHFYTIQ